MATSNLKRKRSTAEQNSPPARDTAKIAAKMQGYFPHYISRVMNFMNLRLLQSVRLYGMTVTQFRIMQVLDSRGIASIGELAVDAVIEQSVVSRIVNQLEELGYAIREKRKSNSRIVDVYLTPQGKKTYEDLFPAAQLIVSDALHVLSKSEHKSLESMLGRIFDHLSQPQEPWLKLATDNSAAKPNTSKPRRSTTQGRLVKSQ
ncbi:MarR family winged helix-turn-helix transcriptional regulator [Ferrovibrio sp.]|uniref:MarR family winged helix-turn-helix transcriptional regulator n=1 Tax=Ferrovibrio sp. TaxID=1917215 RepID=UPI0026347AD0|nr:MarR family winged helix-turn-helix transcriptional regulator [Ferrovibrio sp.]